MYNGAAPVEALRQPRRFVGRLNCPPAVRRALLRAGAFEPRERYSTVAAFLAALDERDGPWTRERILAAVLALLAGIAVTTWLLAGK